MACEFVSRGGTPIAASPSTPRDQVYASPRLGRQRDSARYSPSLTRQALGESPSISPSSVFSRVGLSVHGTPSAPPCAEVPFETPDGDRLQDIPPEWVISSQRRQALLGTATATGTPNAGAVAQHAMHFVIGVLKSWPRMMAAHGTAHLPPVIHRLQLADGMPPPLANCYTLVKMWAGHAEGSRELVQGTILQEVQRLLSAHRSDDNLDILATAQSLLMLLIILFFGMAPASSALAHPNDAQLLIAVWDVKQRLAASGLFLAPEATHSQPSWKQWALVCAKRRTMLGLHHLEFVWSLLHGYPVLTCFELGPLPAPAAAYLWGATDEREWERLYGEWLDKWRHGSYKMNELFRIDSGSSLDARSELWLGETDAFGMMLMAEVNTMGCTE